MDEFLSNLPKKDLSEIEAIWDNVYPKHKQDNKEFLIHSFQASQSDIRASVGGNTAYAKPKVILERTSLGLRKHIIQQALYRRIKFSEVDVLMNGIFTANRLEYFYPMSIMPALLNAMVCKDWTLVDQYLLKYPKFYPIEKRPFPASLAHNILVSLYLNDRSNKEENIKHLQPLLEKKQPEFESALYNALYFLASGHTKNFVDSLEKMLNFNKKKQLGYDSDLAKFICLPAHGLYNLAVKLHQEGQLDAFPDNPKGPYFDHALHEKTNHGESAPSDFFIDFKELSPVFNSWLWDLPTDYDAAQIAQA